MLKLSDLLKENGNLVACYDRAGLFSLAGRGVKNNTADDSFEQNEHGYSLLIHTEFLLSHPGSSQASQLLRLVGSFCWSSSAHFSSFTGGELL